MKLDLAEWDQRIARHLHMIEAGAELCARHVDQMIFRPSFETIAETELVTLENILTTALRRVKQARESYDAKPVTD
jgi:hypothetical protein